MASPLTNLCIRAFCLGARHPDPRRRSAPAAPPS